MPGLQVLLSNPPKRRTSRVAATLTNRIEEIRYQHAQDGRWYKHRFTPGASVKLLRDGRALIERRDGRPVWMEDAPLDNADRAMHYLINPDESPATRRGQPHARTRPRRRTAQGNSMARAKRRRATKRVRHHRRAVAAAHKRVRRAYASNPAPHRRRRRRRHLMNPARRHHRRRRYARNPAFGLNFLVDGLKDGAGVVGGQVATRKVAQLARQYVPGMSSTSGPLAVLPTLAGAVVTSFVARKALPRFSRTITAGAFAEVITGALAQTPVSAMLSGYAPVVPGLRAWPARAALPAAAPVGVRAWPARRVGAVREVG